MNGPVPVNMLWIGDALGRIEVLSIVSWLHHGHEVNLHVYGPVAGVPDGVRLRDAAMTLQKDEAMLLRHRATGSYALASDCFRYRLQLSGAGLWSDLDMICLAPIAVGNDCLFGLEDAANINGAVLYLRSGLPMALELSDLFRNNVLPPWTRPSRARKLKLKRFFGLTFTPADLPWGTYGPRAITELARKHRLFDHAAPPDVFYPLRYSAARNLYNPAFSLAGVLTERTRGLHLWNEVLGDLRKTLPPSGSPLSALLRQFGV